MSDTPTSDEPLEAVADTVGEPVVETFEILGNETRLSILLALWEASVPFAEGTWDPTEGNAVSFSELRDRVGIRQGAQFNYHLDRLLGRFVTKTDDGYELRSAGYRIVRTVVALAGFGADSFPPTEIDVGCANCGAPIEITYQNQRVYYLCAECGGNVTLSDEHPSNVLGAEKTKPAVLKDRGPEGVYDAVRTEVFYDHGKRAAGVCPVCSGEVDATLSVCDAHNRGDGEPCSNCGRRSECTVQFVCSVCKHMAEMTVTSLCLCHPAVIGFAWEHDCELGFDSHETARVYLELYESTEARLVSRDPPRVRVAIHYEGETLRLRVDEDLTVVDASGTD